MKTVTVTTGASTSISVLIAWFWNAMNPDSPMSAEVAAAVGGLIGPLVDEIRTLRRVLVARWFGLDTE